MTTTSPSTGSTKISLLGGSAALDGTEFFPATQSGVTKRVTASQIAQFVSLYIGQTVVVPTGGDDTATIQAAINSITAGVVYLSVGTFRISSPLALKDSVSLAGDGPGATIINNTGAGTTALNIKNGSNNIRNSRVKDLRITGGSVGGIGIDATMWGNLDALENVQIDLCTIGLKVTNAYTLRISNCRINNNSSHGIDIETGSNNLTLRGTMCVSNGGDNIRVNGANIVLIDGCDLESPTANQLNIISARGLVFRNNYLEGFPAAAGGVYGILCQSVDTADIDGNFWNNTNNATQTWLKANSGCSRVNWGRSNAFSAGLTGVTFVNFASGSNYCTAYIPTPGTGTFVNASATNRVYFDPDSESGADYFNSTNITLTNNSWIALTWDTKIEDPKSELSSATFTPSDYGKYDFVGAIGVTSIGAGKSVLIRLRDTTAAVDYAYIEYTSLGAGSPVLPFHFSERLGPANTMQVQVQVQDTADRATTGGQQTSWIRAKRLS